MVYWRTSIVFGLLICSGDEGVAIGWRSVRNILHATSTVHSNPRHDDVALLALFAKWRSNFRESATSSPVCVLPDTAQSYAVTLAAVMLYEDVPGLRLVRLNRLRYVCSFGCFAMIQIKRARRCIFLEYRILCCPSYA